ncbi:MAG TPA: protein kinase [Longilinea sp.]|nr:protein kinase [Longilinea sp.]
MEPQPESILNERYRIMRKLGQGGMGAVYLAQDTVLDQVAAVKYNHTATAQGTSQFLREARLLATLRHPNLPRVTDYFVLGEDQYLVMDYIPGDDLDSLLKQKGGLPLDMAMQVAEQLCSALSYLHSQNPPVIHRDIKPGNIKLTPSNEIVLVDFGIAKSGDGSQITTTGAAGLTPGFSPPEQYGSSHTGPYSDQYALAATIYTVLANHKPPDAFQRVLNEAVLTPLLTFRADLPPGVAAAIEKALSLHPQDRFPTINDFYQALIDASGNNIPTSKKSNLEPIQPMPGTIPNVTAKRTTRSKPKQPRTLSPLSLGVIIGGGLAALAGVTFLLVLLLAGSPMNASGTSTPQTNSNNAASTPTLKDQSADQTQAPGVDIAQTVTLTPEPSITPTVSIEILGGGAIAYISDQSEDGFDQVWLMEVSMNNTGQFDVISNEQLTTDDGDKSDPAWSPDGTQLLFVAPSGQSSLGLDIWVLELSAPGIPPVNLSQHAGDDTLPAWSPDGSTIAFTSLGSNGIRQVYLMNADGSNIRRASYSLQEYAPAWSPEMSYLSVIASVSGRQVLYLRTSAAGYSNDPPQAFDTRELMGRLGNVAEVDWSPDGTQIMYTRQEGVLTNLYVTVVEERGNRIQQITTSGFDTNPTWSSDQQWVAFTSRRDGNAEIYLMNSNGAMQTNLTNLPGNQRQPAWQPAP